MSFQPSLKTYSGFLGRFRVPVVADVIRIPTEARSFPLPREQPRAAVPATLRKLEPPKFPQKDLAAGQTAAFRSELCKLERLFLLEKSKVVLAFVFRFYLPANFIVSFAQFVLLGLELRQAALQFKDIIPWVVGHCSGYSEMLISATHLSREVNLRRNARI